MSDQPIDNFIAPLPVVRKSHFPFPIVWLVPLLAALGAGYYFYLMYQRHGREIIITFPDVSGMKTGETPLTVHGVRVGTVFQVDLAEDESHANVHVRLQRNADPVGRTGTLFWLVRPGISGGNIIGLSTVVTGPYIEALPGPGAQTDRFQGIDKPPTIEGPGIKVILHAARVEHSQLDSPVYYRGIQVGTVQDIRLASDATQVNLTLFIWQKYQALLKSTSQFYSVKPAKVEGGLLSGLSLDIGSLRSQLGGGVSFATPDDGVPAVDGMEYNLHDDAKPEWLLWTPQIFFNHNTGKGDKDVAQEESGLRSTVRVK